MSTFILTNSQLVLPTGKNGFSPSLFLFIFQTLKHRYSGWLER